MERCLHTVMRQNVRNIAKSDKNQKAGFSEKAQANVLAQIQEESGFKPRSEELDKYNFYRGYTFFTTKDKKTET